MDNNTSPFVLPDNPTSGLDNFIPYLMNRVMHRYNQTLLETMSDLGLTVPKMRTLVALASYGTLTINQLTVYAVTEQSTLSRVLDQMEKSGLVVRKTSTEDSRVRNIFLTPTGRSAYEKVWPDMQAAQSAMFEGLSEPEQQVFLETLCKVLANIRLNDF